MPVNNAKCVDLPSASVQYKSVSNQRSLNKNENDNDKGHDKDNDRLTTGDVFFLRSVDGDLGDRHNGSYVRASCGGECDKLKQIISTSQIHHVVLSNSNGGNANTGYCIGETIRKHKISTSIEGFCLSSCSRMWLGGVTRKLEGDESTVGLHGNYKNSGHLIDESTTRLRAWIPRFAPDVDVALMNQWTELFYNKQMMYFYNKRAALCLNGRNDCSNIRGKNVFNAGLATQ